MKNPYCSLIIFMLFSLLSCRNTPIEHNSKVSDNSKIDSILLTHFYENIIDYNNIDWKDYIKEESNYLDSLYFIVYETPINGYEVKIRLSHLSESFEGFTGMATVYFKRNNRVVSLLHPTFFIEDSLFSKLSTHRIDTINYTLISFGNEINNELGQFKDVPFAFYDVDFDGEKELLLRHPSIGQRETNGYTAFKVPDNNRYDFEEVRLYESIKRYNDFPIFDDFTEFDFENKYIVLKSYQGNGNFLKNQYKVLGDSITKIELTDYGEPFPIEVIKECKYYNVGKEPQKNIQLKDLFGEWEFERDIKANLKFNPDMTYREIREGYLIDEENNSKPYKKVKRGKFTFKDNVLTLLDYYKKEELHPTDWKKYKNPLNHELVVFSLRGDTLSLYESGVDTYKYVKKKIL